MSLCGTLLGWGKSRLDARAQLVRAEVEFERIRGGVRIEAGVYRLVYVSELLSKNDLLDAGQKATLHRELIFAMWELYVYESRIDLAYPGDSSATELAGRILKLLNCESIDDFFSLGRDLYEDPEDWPEYFDIVCQDHLDYRAFVSRGYEETIKEASQTP